VRARTLVVGVDEAGYGPLLGPLVVSATAFELPAGMTSETLWNALAGAVSRDARRSGGRIAIADSKRLYAGTRDRAGLARLERGALAVIAATGAPPPSMRALLAAIAPQATGEAGRSPWYDLDGDALPVACDASELGAAAELVGAALRHNGVRFAGMHSEVIFEPRYNARVAALGSKAAVLFEAVTSVLRRAWDEGSPQRVAVIDRQGGRAHYGALLEAAFPEAFVWIRSERPASSAYTLAAESWSADVRFEVRAEGGHLPVALASMVSKYLRESFMLAFNRYWRRVVPGLAPTSGYWTDGRAFLAAIAPELEARAIPLDEVRRVR
jgi:hypothetical protein